MPAHADLPYVLTPSQPDIRRRHLLGASLALPFVALPLAACGGGGGGDTGGVGGGGAGGGGGGAGATRSGRIVVKASSLSVVDAASGQNVAFPAASTTNPPGVGVSRSGQIGDVWDYTGSDTWRIAIRSLAGALINEYTVGGLLAFPTSAAVLSADGTQMAYAVNEITSNSNSTRLDRVYVNDLRTGALLARIDNRQEPAFLDSGGLLLRNGDKLHVVDAQWRDQGPLQITVSLRIGGYSASPDGRYVAYEDGSRIRVLDRNTGSTWFATTLEQRSHYAPVFSPDGQWLAFLRAGAVALRYLNVIPFAVDSTRTVQDSDEIKAAGGQGYPGVGRIGWAR